MLTAHIKLYRVSILSLSDKYEAYMANEEVWESVEKIQMNSKIWKKDY